MPRRIAITNLNASTIDILNTIRANAPYEYQSSVPEVTTEHDIPRVGEVICGYPSLANHFVNALVNRIALTKIKSATFNNAYAELKKGYLEFGETVEEVFVNIAKAREFSTEKAASREFKRTLPDVRTAFHAMNWRTQYPVTVQNEDLRQAFLSISGVQDLIAKIVNSVYTGAEYDEYLLFKYLIIKAVAHGKMHPVAVGDGTDLKVDAAQYRGISNDLTFLKTKYNISGVHTSTPKEDQMIFMDSFYNAKFDVNVLASAFNMEKADFMGKLKLIDSFDTFDNDRFAEIRENSDMIEEVTAAELALMKDVKACIIDREWFQIYDNLMQMSEATVGSGLYWNYFLNVWKTVSSSPFSNAIVFVASSANITADDTVTLTVTGKTVGDNATILTLEGATNGTTLKPTEITFLQTEDCTEDMVAVHKYGAVIYPTDADAQYIVVEIGGKRYISSTTLASSANVGATLTMQNVAGLSALAITGVTLSPAFALGTETYTGTTSTATGTISMSKVDSDATVTVTCNGTEVSGTTLSFNTGANVVKVNVKNSSPFGNVEKTYTITVTKS